ncbi:sulfatase-like hydrolase/transferase, partial [bacterium]|nr:sulfatase-like hydrolase/transferase [candidate division CSSED10-310 bacterium]
LRCYGRQPFFLFVHCYDVHEPYRSPPPWPDIFPPRPNVPDVLLWSHSYDSAIAYTDQFIGGMIRILADLGCLQDTAVIVTSDHGEEFGEHNGHGHGATVFRETVEVPLLLWASWLPSGRVVEGTAASIDIAPTLLAMSGITPPDTMHGHPLQDFFTGDGIPARAIFSENEDRMLFGIRTEDRLILTEHDMDPLFFDTFGGFRLHFADDIHEVIDPNGSIRITTRLKRLWYRLFGNKDWMAPFKMEMYLQPDETMRIDTLENDDIVRYKGVIDAWIKETNVYREGEFESINADEELTEQFKQLGYIK